MTMLTAAVALEHTCPSRIVFNPNCPACVAGSTTLAGVDQVEYNAVPPLLATRANSGCTEDDGCDCPFCPRGEAAVVRPPAPLPLPTGARLYRIVTTRRTAYVWGVGTGNAHAIFMSRAFPLGVPAAPQPAERPGETNPWEGEPTAEWLAWFHRYRRNLWNRLDHTSGECLLQVLGPYPR